MPNLFHQPSPTPAWNPRLDALHAQSPSQPTQNLDLHSFSVQHKSEQPLAMQMHSHLFLPLRCYQFIFWTMARGRLFPWREFSWMIQKASFLTQLSQISSATPACLDPRRKPQTQVRSVQPLHIRVGLVWASDTSQGAHMRGTDRLWIGNVMFCHFCNHPVQNDAPGSSPGLATAVKWVHHPKF